MVFGLVLAPVSATYTGVGNYDADVATYVEPYEPEHPEEKYQSEEYPKTEYSETDEIELDNLPEYTLYLPFPNGLMQVDKSYLLTAIEYAQGLTRSHFVFVQWNNKIPVLAQAIVVSENVDATQIQIDNATAALKAAIAALIPDPFRAELGSLIAQAEDLDEKDFTFASWVSLQTVLASVIPVLYTMPPGNPQLWGPRIAALANAINNLVCIFEFDVLTTTIAQAQSLTESNYSAQTWAALQVALTSAITVRDATVHNIAQVETATTNLLTAIDNLEYTITWQAAMVRGLDNIVSTVHAPQFGSVGGEWAVLALARAGHPVPYGYFETYIHQIGERLLGVGITTDPNSAQNAGGQFPLNRVYNPVTNRYEVRLGNQAQSTENARLVVALTSLGVDASNFTHGGVTFDLVAQFGQRNNATSNQMWGEGQGLNGPIWNLIALNSRGWGEPYEITDRAWVGGTTTSNPITLNERIGWILDRQLGNGGWALFGSASDPDMTAMALQALAPYRNMPGVAAAIDRALEELERTQLPNGGWASFGADNVQSPAQIVVALTGLGINPMTDPRFVMPGGYNPINTMLRFFDPIAGGFRHPIAGGVNLMATEQAVYSLVAYWRFIEGMNSLYDMSDVFAPPPVEVNRAALNAAIIAAEARAQSSYTAASWTALQIALDTARQVRDNVNTTQNTVNTAADNLTAAINALIHADTGQPGGGQPGTGEPSRSRVSLTVYNPNARQGDPALFLQGGAVRQMYIYIDPNETAYSVLHKAEAGLNIRSRGHHVWAGMYVEALNNFGEFDGGPLSGWMFAVNRVFPAHSASLTYLQNGDRLYWLYTYELGGDIIPRFGIFEGGDLGTNRIALRNAIARAEQRIQAHYTTESWATFLAALNVARRVYNNPAATQNEINDAELSLIAAYNALAQTNQAGGSGVPGGSPGDYLDGDEYEEAEEEIASDPEATITEDMVADGGAVAKIIEGLLRQAYEDGAAGITIFVPAAEDATSIDLGLIVRTLRETAAEGFSLTIRTDIAILTLDMATLAGIARDMDDDKTVRIIVEMVDAKTLPDSLQRGAIGSNTAVRLMIMVGDAVISNFDGIVTVIIPYTPSIAACSFDLLTVYYVDNLGNIKEVPGTRYENSNIIFTTSNFSIFFISEWISPFADVDRYAWYFRNVRFVYSNGLMVGIASGQFSPDTHLSRGMLVTLLWRMEGMPTVENDNYFHDVAEGRWYSDAVAWASANGIARGHGNGTFAPDENITREQLALIVQNYARFNGSDVFVGTFADEFTDIESISSWAMDAMMWANTNGLLTGRTMTTLAPDGTATRAEAAGIIQRFMEM